MITIRGKEIKPEIVTMWINVVSSVIGLIFYADVLFNFSHPRPEIVPENKAKDSLLVIDARLHEDIRQLKSTEDSLLLILNKNRSDREKGAAEQQIERKQIYQTIQGDWDKLSKKDQDKYVDQLLIKIKKHQI